MYIKENTFNDYANKYIETGDEKYIEKIIMDDKFIYYILKKCGITKTVGEEFVLDCYTYDDIVSVAYEALFRAFNTYDKTKNIMFSSYYSYILTNAVNMIRRKERKKRDYQFLSLNDCMYDGFGGNRDLTFADIIPDETINIHEDLENSDMINFILNHPKLTEKELSVLKFILEGKTQVEISEIMGNGQSYISRLFKKAIKKIK